MVDEKKFEYEVKEFATAVDSAVVNPDGQSLTDRQVLAEILTAVKRLERKLIG